MKVSNLTTVEVQDLINKYYSELRKLEFQVSTINGIIQDLENQMKTSDVAAINNNENNEWKSNTPKKRGRKKSVFSTDESTNASLNGNGISKKVETESRSKAGRKKGRKRKTGGYKLSDFDSFIIGSLKNAGHVLVNSDFLNLAEKNNVYKQFDLDENQLKAKLNRSLFKMANRRDELIKVDYPGKGFAYALNNWADEYGNLKKRYKRDFENI